MIALRVRGRASSSWGSVAAAQLGSGAAGARGRWGGPGPRTSSPWDTALSDQDTRLSPLFPGVRPPPSRDIPSLLPSTPPPGTARSFVPGHRPPLSGDGSPSRWTPARPVPLSTKHTWSRQPARRPRPPRLAFLRSCRAARAPGSPSSARLAPGLQVVPRAQTGSPWRSPQRLTRAVSGGPALRVSRAVLVLLGKADLNSNFPVTLVAKHCDCRAPELTFSCCTCPNYRQKGLVGPARTGPLNC